MPALPAPPLWHQYLAADREKWLATDHNINMTFKGNRNDIVAAEATMNKVRVGAKRRVAELNADKSYDSRAFRRKMRRRCTTTNIPERKFTKRCKRGRKPHMNKDNFKFRAFVERTNA